MKISLALGPRQPLSRQTAWGCLTTNLATPGIGSLMAGRGSGYAQAALSFGGLFLTVVFGARFALWYVTNWSRLHDPHTDQMAGLEELWIAVRWALLGIALFAFGWVWGLASGLAIVQESRRSEPPNVPPRLTSP